MPYLLADRQREFQRRSLADRRAAYLAGKVCVRCGSAASLNVHHRDPELKVSHSVWSWAEVRRLVELAKCEVLCEDCHKAVHAAWRRADALTRNPHGNRRRYELGCRCRPCRNGKNLSNRSYREGRGGVVTKPREAWMAVVQSGDDEHQQETEVVTLERAHAEAGATIELTDGTRITLVEPVAA